MIYILYNPISNNKMGEGVKAELESFFSGKELSFSDVREIKDYKAFFEKVSDEDKVILAGGDGTLNHFVNDVYDLNITQQVLYYPSGSGNDFAHDVENSEKVDGKFIVLNEFIKSLPEVSVNGIKKRFINGIGYGIDGYCCEVGDEMREKSDKPVNYAGIAIKGLLGKFHPSNATVTIDGKSYSYKNVWLAPSMIGKYYGGGMMVAPAQDRLNAEKTLSLVVWANRSKLGTLCAFPSIFKGEHIKHTKMITIFTGHDIKVQFDKPQALQIDGETVKKVSEYSVSYR